MNTLKLTGLAISAFLFFCALANAQPASGSSKADHREYVIRFTPSLGYLSKDGGGDPLLRRLGIKKELESFDEIILNADVDYEIYPNLFATGSFMYAHDFYNDPIHGGVDIYGFPLGIRYVVLQRDLPNRVTAGMDNLRFWVGASMGPYMMDEEITVNIGGRNSHGSSTNAALGVNAHAGFDYFFSRHIGLGVQGKFQYLLFDNNVMIVSGGPSIIGRF